MRIGVFEFLALSMFVIIVLSLSQVVSNPIPAPTIILDHEYVVFNLTYSGNGVVHVDFYGRYDMRNVGYSLVTMYFPIPNETDRDTVSVFVNHVKAGPLYYTWTMTLQGHVYRYDTAYGPLPMVMWTVPGKLDKYVVEVYYSYNFSLVNNTFGRTIYALGTGRFYYTYSKQCIADIRLYMEGFNNTLLTLKLVEPYGEEESIVYAALLNGEFNDTLSILSPQFSGFTRDLVFNIEKLNPGEYVEVPPANLTFSVRSGLREKYLGIHGEIIVPGENYEISRLSPRLVDNKVRLEINTIKLSKMNGEESSEKPVTLSYEVYVKTNNNTDEYVFQILVNSEVVYEKNVEITLPSHTILSGTLTFKQPPTTTTAQSTTTTQPSTTTTTTTTTTTFIPPDKTNHTAPPDSKDHETLGNSLLILGIFIVIMAMLLLLVKHRR